MIKHLFPAKSKTWTFITMRTASIMWQFAYCFRVRALTEGRTYRSATLLRHRFHHTRISRSLSVVSQTLYHFPPCRAFTIPTLCAQSNLLQKPLPLAFPATT